MVFWSVAHAVRQGDIADVYSPKGISELTNRFATTAQDPSVPKRQKAAAHLVLGFENGSIDVVSTPFLFSALSLWEHGDYERDLTLFSFSSLLFYALSIVALCRAFGFHSITAAFFLILFCIGFDPHTSDMRVANINSIQLFGVALFLWIQRKPGLYRDVGSGLVGLSIMLKPTIALVAVLLAAVWLINRPLEKAGRVFVGGLGGAVLAVLVSTIFFGTVACWTQWFHVAPALVQSKGERGKGGLEFGNYGFASVLHSMMSIDASNVLLLVLLCAFAYIAWASRTRARFGKHEKNGWTAQPVGNDNESLFFETASAVCLGLTFMLLSSNLVWWHYYVLAIPAIIFAFSISFQVGNSAMQAPVPRVLSLIGAVCLIRFPLDLLPLPRVFQVLTFNVGVIIISLVIAYGLMVREKDSRVNTSASPRFSGGTSFN